MYTHRMIQLFAVVLAISFIGSAVQAAQPPADLILQTLPEDCIAVVRINNLNDALAKLDTYLAGAVPLPVAMTVNMQLAGILGDPALTGIDKAGSFVLLAMQAGEDEVKAGMLIPLTGFDELTGSNQHITKSEDGTALLQSPQSPIGAIALSSVLNGKYALAVPESEKEALGLLKKAIEDKSTKRLAGRLNAAQTKEAVSSPLWSFLNIALIYDKYGEDLTAAIEEGMQAATQEATGGMMAAVSKIYAEMFKTFVGEADSLTLALQPEAALLTLDTTLRAKEGSELAKMLQADPAAAKAYQLAGFTDSSFAVNALMRINQPLLQHYNEMMVQIMDAAGQDGTSAEESQKMKDVMAQMMQMMGNEIAFSFSYASGTPPLRLREVIALKEGSSMKTLMPQGIEIANSMYKSMEMPIEISYITGAETYQGVAIDVLKMSFMKAEDEADEEIAEAIQSMYGTDGMQYYAAQKGNLMLVAMGPKGLDEIKAMIDQPAAAAASSDIKGALDLLSGTGHTDLVMSMNIIRLMKGLGEMLQSMGGGAMPDMVKNIFSGINIQSQSSLIMGGKIADGQFGLRTALPKQHLVEVMTAVMQIQQQMMQQQMQQQQQTQPNESPAAGAMIPFATPEAAANAEAASLQTWVGKKAPELKMVDLQGQTQRISRLKGKKVVLDFWATWCPPCKESIPHLIALRNQVTPETAAIIGLSNEPQDKVSEYVKTANINYTIAVYSDELPAPYGQVTGLPTAFLIDAEGTIVDVLEGYDPDTTPQKIEAFLK